VPHLFLLAILIWDAGLARAHGLQEWGEPVAHDHCRIVQDRPTRDVVAARHLVSGQQSATTSFLPHDAPSSLIGSASLSPTLPVPFEQSSSHANCIKALAAVTHNGLCYKNDTVGWGRLTPFVRKAGKKQNSQGGGPTPGVCGCRAPVHPRRPSPGPARGSYTRAAPTLSPPSPSSPPPSFIPPAPRLVPPRRVRAPRPPRPS
jgi:hypothetical protein